MKGQAAKSRQAVRAGSWNSSGAPAMASGWGGSDSHAIAKFQAQPQRHGRHRTHHRLPQPRLTSMCRTGRART
ncbi:hypothetical protein [Peterkaempfera griseoplana]|uniref:hypothetical protein n=1 Tax=Peterkaempfera griseoplana TaxID=66896 RepID=UPI00147015B5|nr:hypothetical protein [Peterkaempfera griseoplana]